MASAYFQPSAGARAFSSTQGAAPTTRLDAFLRNTDANYLHAEAAQPGDRFVRHMATYGQVRPSPCFVSESRQRRPFNKDSVFDMSKLPAPWYGMRGGAEDTCAGTLVVPQPKGDCSLEFVELYKNDKLMLPSERREEARRILAGESQWKEERQAHFGYKKTMQALDLRYPSGVLGVDGPMYPETRIYAERRQTLQNEARKMAHHAEGRFEHLAGHVAGDDAATLRRYGSAPNLARSRDVGIQRKGVDSEVHKFRFMNTHERLFPKHIAVWHPTRAAMLRSHDVRDRHYDPVSGADNAVEFKVAKNWGLPDPAQAAQGGA